MTLLERIQGSNIASELGRRALESPDRPFLLFGEGELTFSEVERRAGWLAASLHSLGVAPGDRIALLLPCRSEFAIALFAAARLGACIVPLNPRLTRTELHYMLRHSRAVCAISIEHHHGEDYVQLFDELLDRLPELEHVVTVGEEDLWYDDRIFQFEDLLSKGQGRPVPATEARPDERFALVYTSGTTGKPKGVELSHANLLHGAASAVVGFGLTGEDRVVGVTDFFHVFGIAAGLLGCLLAGAALVLQEEFDAPAALDLIERHGVTFHYGLPTFFATELLEQRRAPRNLSSLRGGAVAGAGLSDGLLSEVGEVFGIRLCPAYSLTEAASLVTVTHPEDPPNRRRFTVGRPLPGTTIRVLGPDGMELPVESLGEIVVKGPGVMIGYYRQPRETSLSLTPDGFLRTGDIGMTDEEGYLHLVGRGSDVIIRAGFSVHPGEVEDRLLTHPAVRDAAVVGVPDEVMGEVIGGCVVLMEGAVVTPDELRDWCRMTLSGYKVPDLVLLLDRFPLSSTGKIRRTELSRLCRDGIPNPSE